jgi:hypothetical protein
MRLFYFHMTRDTTDYRLLERVEHTDNLTIQIRIVLGSGSPCPLVFRRFHRGRPRPGHIDLPRLKSDVARPRLHYLGRTAVTNIKVSAAHPEHIDRRLLGIGGFDVNPILQEHLTGLEMRRLLAG